MGQSRGYYDGLGDPGIALMFSFSVAYLTYRVKSRGFGRDPTSIVLKQLLGKSEAPSVRRESSRRPSIKPVADCASLNNARSIIASRPQLLTAGTDRLQNQLRPDSIANQRSQRFALLRRTWLQLTRWTRFSLKHSTCQHDEPNCALYAAQGFLTPFLVGYIGPALIRSLLNPSRFAAAPLASIWRQLSNGRSVNVALFLGLFSGGFRAGCCSLRWATNSNADWHVFAAAAVAGLASLKAPSSTVATYFLWKAIESGYVDMFKKGEPSHEPKPSYSFCRTSTIPGQFDSSRFISLHSCPSHTGFLPNPMYISPLLYAISVNTIFYAGILEPYNVRPSYAKFIERITQNRIHLINRSLLAVFGTNAFIGFEEFWPDLDPRLCSNEFMETVMLWKLGDK